MASLSTEELGQTVAAAVVQRLGQNDPQLQEMIAAEIDRTFAETTTGTKPTVPSGDDERIVISATGRNTVGIVARLAAAIVEFSGDIQDISQTVVGEYFTMIIVVDISGATSQGTTFAQLKQRLLQIAEDMGIHVVALHDDILSTMHGV
jgi:ACT domain-containing protein